MLTNRFFLILPAITSHFFFVHSQSVLFALFLVSLWFVFLFIVLFVVSTDINDIISVDIIDIANGSQAVL